MTFLTLLTDHTKHLLGSCSVTRYCLIKTHIGLSLIREGYLSFRDEPALCLKTFELVKWYTAPGDLHIIAPGMLKDDISSFPGINDYIYRKNRNGKTIVQRVIFENRPIPDGKLPPGLVFVKSDLPEHPGRSRLMVGLTLNAWVAPPSIGSNKPYRG